MSGFHEHWQSELESSNEAISHNMGALCLTVTVSCYLASAEAHVQMEVVNNQIVPILQERGISLHWKTCNTFMKTISDVSGPPSSSDNDGDRDSIQVAELGGGDEDMSAGARSSKALLSCSYASLSGCVLTHMISESLADRWLSLAATHHSPPYLLCSGLICTSWNRWPLVYDPQDLALRSITQCNKDVVCMDATNR